MNAVLCGIDVIIQAFVEIVGHQSFQIFVLMGHILGTKVQFLEEK